MRWFSCADASRCPASGAFRANRSRASIERPESRGSRSGACSRACRRRAGSGDSMDDRGRSHHRHANLVLKLKTAGSAGTDSHSAVRPVGICGAGAAEEFRSANRSRRILAKPTTPWQADAGDQETHVHAAIRTIIKLLFETRFSVLNTATIPFLNGHFGAILLPPIISSTSRARTITFSSANTLDIWHVRMSSSGSHRAR